MGSIFRLAAKMLDDLGGDMVAELLRRIHDIRARCWTDLGLTEAKMLSLHQEDDRKFTASLETRERRRER